MDALVSYDASLGAPKSATQRYSDIAGDIAAESGIAMGGQVLGAETGPLFFAIAPAAGAYGNYVKQQRQIERGERKDLSYGEMITSGLINAIPLSAMFKTGATVGETVTRQALLGTGIEAGREAISKGEQAIQEKRFPTLDDFYSVLEKGSHGTIMGAAAGGGLEAAKALTPAAKALWGRLAGKTEGEANAVLQQVAAEGTDGERKAAAELLDTVGQNLGLVRPTAKAAQESAQVLGQTTPSITLPRFAFDRPAREGATAADVLLAERAAIAQRGGAGAQFGSEASQAMAGSRPTPAQVETVAVRVGERPLGGFGSEAERIGSQVKQAPVKSAATSAADIQAALAERAPSSATTFERAYQEGQTQAGAVGLSQRLAAEQQAAVRAGDFDRARGLEDIARQIEANRLMSPERIPAASVLESTMVKPAGKVGRNMGSSLPTTEDILNEFSAIRGVGSKQGARKMSMEGGNISSKAMAGVAGAGVAGVGIASALASQPKMVEVETPAGIFRYDTSKYSDDEIDRDVAKKMTDFKKVQAAGDALNLRAQVANAPSEEAGLKMMLDWSNAQRAAALAAKTFIQAAGSRLPAAGRMASGVVGEYASGAIMGQMPTPGQVAQSAIESAPRGSTSLGANLLQFGAAGAAGEAARQAIDLNKPIDLETAAKAAALGGVRALAMKAVESGSVAKAETARQRRDFGEIDMYNDGKRLGIVLDPGARTNPDIKQVAGVKLSGGSAAFQQSAARINTPIVIDKVKELAGSTGNPDIDGKLNDTFFRARRLQEGQIYQTISALPNMKQKVEDWKQANSTAISEYKKWNANGKNENLVAAREARTKADDLHLQISNDLRRMGQGGLVNDLDTASKKIAELHTLEAAVGPTGKITEAKVWGQMYEDNPKRYKGDLGALMRIAAAQPGVLQDASAIPIKRGSWEDLVQVPMLRQFMTSPAGQSMFNQQRYGTMDPSFLAQMAGLGGQGAVNQAIRSIPLR